MNRIGRIQQALAYWCLNATEWKWDIDRICQKAVALGCSSVELAPPELWHVVAGYGLKNSLVLNGMPDPVFSKGLNNPRYQEEVIARTKQVIDQCPDFGIPNVICFTGYKWRDAEDPSSGEISLGEGAANTVKGMRELASYAASRGVTMVIEQLNTRDASHPMKGHPGYQGDDMDYCAEIVRQVDSPNAKLLFDVYHCAIMNGDVIRRIHQYGTWIGHVHVAGVPGRAELDGGQEIHFPGVMRALVEVGYRGWVGQEFIPTRDPDVGLAEAVAVCDV
ncbi:MAG: Xylose isomerase domain protein barrel [Candidatus Solibacter sp.]|nr:Xylose isomerase domain protein barrel [Candidatus Solibacter sp.]